MIELLGQYLAVGGICLLVGSAIGYYAATQDKDRHARRSAHHPPGR